MLRRSLTRVNCPILAARRCCSAALNDRAPAPICVGGVYRPRLELGGPLSRCPAPGLECRPPSPRPTVSSPGLQAGCARVEGVGWVVGWGFEPHSRATPGLWPEGPLRVVWWRRAGRCGYGHARGVCNLFGFGLGPHRTMQSIRPNNARSPHRWQWPAAAGCCASSWLICRGSGIVSPSVRRKI